MEKKKATTRPRATTSKTTATKKTTAPRAATPRTRKAASTPTAAKPLATSGAGAPGAGFRPSHEQIAAFAYSLFEQSGQQHGRALEHWLEAESKLQQGLKV